MARLQILELPEGSNDDRPPYLLIVDQVDDELAEDIARWPDDIAKRTGARHILCFPGTIDIPANDTSGYLVPPTAKQDLVVELNGDPTTVKPRQDWCCSLAFQTIGKQHIDDCRQGNAQP